MITDKLIAKQEYKSYINTEFARAAEDDNYESLLSPFSLQNKGLGIYNLDVESTARSEGDLIIKFTVTNNISRFRTGDRVTSTNRTETLNGIVLENHFEYLTVLVKKKGTIKGKSGWSVISSSAFYGSALLAAIERIAPGVPGWSFFDFMVSGNDIPAPLYPPTRMPDSEYTEKLVSAFVFNDISQIKVIKKCLTLPPLYAVQGPPGTGKSRVLSIVAELLASAGYRVAVIAFTHLAVNSVLEEINKINPERELVKIGDEFKAENLSVEIKKQKFNVFHKQYLQKKRDNTEPIIGITFHSALSNLGSRNNAFQPNVVLIDEAGQLSLTYGAFTGLFGASSIQLFGDDSQMSPIFHPELKNHPISISFFAGVRKNNPKLIDSLNTTYRLNEPLSDLIGRYFYPDNSENGTFLRSSEGAKSRSFDISPEKCPEPFREILDASPFVWVSSKSNYNTQVNYREAEIAAQIVDICLKQGYSKQSIAVVSPFRKQCAEIIRSLLKKGHKVSDIPVVDTVERIQGQTVDIVIVSYTSSDIDYIQQRADFLLSKNRLNVAISRAKTKVVLLMSETFLTCIPFDYESILTQRIIKNLCNESKQVDMSPYYDN